MSRRTLARVFGSRGRHAPPSWVDASDHVVFEHVTKSFGAVVALRDINLRIKRHETAVFIGGSGSGKTTLGRLVAALDTATEGHIWLDGEDIAQLSERRLTDVRKRFGMVFQQHALLDSMTVLDNVAFQLREHRPEIDASEVEARVIAALHEVRLPGKERRRPSELSGGERKRVAIARALILEPELVVYDEPTSGLDPAQIVEIRQLIRNLAEHATVILSTHILSEVENTCERVLMIAAGTVRADSSLDELRGSHARNAAIVHIESGAKNVADTLRKLDGITSVKRDAQSGGEFSSWRVIADEDVDLCPTLFEALRQQSWKVAELRQDRKSLESVFREIVAAEAAGAERSATP